MSSRRRTRPAISSFERGCARRTACGGAGVSDGGEAISGSGDVVMARSSFRSKTNARRIVCWLTHSTFVGPFPFQIRSGTSAAIYLPGLVCLRYNKRPIAARPYLAGLSGDIVTFRRLLARSPLSDQREAVRIAYGHPLAYPAFRWVSGPP